MVYHSMFSCKGSKKKCKRQKDALNMGGGGAEEKESIEMHSLNVPQSSEALATPCPPCHSTLQAKEDDDNVWCK